MGLSQWAMNGEVEVREPAWNCGRKGKVVHCFWETETDGEVELEQVHVEGSVYWAQSVSEAQYWEAAAGGLVIPLKETELQFQEGEVSVMEQDWAAVRYPEQSLVHPGYLGT